jgi:competence ComEA-like helix-hairpin-helix protein
MARTARINLNIVSREILDRIFSLGPDLSEDIINYREVNGPFKNWESLKSIAGITDSLIEDMMRGGAGI